MQSFLACFISPCDPMWSLNDSPSPPLKRSQHFWMTFDANSCKYDWYSLLSSIQWAKLWGHVVIIQVIINRVFIANKSSASLKKYPFYFKSNFFARQKVGVSSMWDHVKLTHNNILSWFINGIQGEKNRET